MPPSRFPSQAGTKDTEAVFSVCRQARRASKISVGTPALFFPKLPLRVSATWACGPDARPHIPLTSWWTLEVPTSTESVQSSMLTQAADRHPAGPSRSRVPYKIDVICKTSLGNSLWMGAGWHSPTAWLAGGTSYDSQRRAVVEYYKEHDATNLSFHGKIESVCAPTHSALIDGGCRGDGSSAKRRGKCRQTENTASVFFVPAYDGNQLRDAYYIGKECPYAIRKETKQ
ncbi:hypothetical protein C8R47DRAFT_1064123 [Mycena vitilis]|nr:hypothetical protein C8R47DRAFT_1064123 [Mycena vitilis]